VMFTPTQSYLGAEGIPPSRRPSQIMFSMLPALDRSTTETPENAPSRPSLSSSAKTGFSDPLVTSLYESTASSSTHRPSEVGISQRSSDAPTFVAIPELKHSYPLIGVMSDTVNVKGEGLSPVLSQDGKFTSDEDKSSRISLDLSGDMTGIIDMDVVNRLRWDQKLEVEEPKEQTLAEYLQETAFDGDGHGHGGTDASQRVERGLNSVDGNQMSATAYFNRQASLLMLYFPLAVSYIRVVTSCRSIR
jgi:hypothetical protein